VRVWGQEMQSSMPALEFRVLGLMMRNLQHYPRDNMFQMMILPNLCLYLKILWLCSALQHGNRITNRRV